MNNTISSVNNGSAPVLSVSGSQSGDAIGQINDLMVNLGQLFGKMRDLLRQYNQTQQLNAFEMQTKSLDTRMAAIVNEFDAKNAQAWTQIGTGALQALGGAASSFGASRGAGETLGWLAHSGDVSKGVGSLAEGIVNRRYVNPVMRESQEEQAVADYQHGLADQLLKRSDETLEKALKASSDLRELLGTLTQAHERIASSVRHS